MDCTRIESGDFCYVFLDTVRFYLRKSSKNDYISTEDELAKLLLFLCSSEEIVSSDFGKVYSMQ